MANKNTFLSFKDVGEKETERDSLRRLQRDPIPIGIKTPLELDETGRGLFAMHYSLRDQIADNLRNLIQTNHGERLGIYDFGANLRPLISEWSNKEDFDKEAMRRIANAVAKYMSFVNLLGYESRPNYRDNIYTGIIDFTIMYAVPALNLNEEIIEVTLYVI
jgi:phage baseplate assembly protein W